MKDVLFLLAPFLPTLDLEVPVRDPEDAPVVVAAVQGRAHAIVTGDRDLLTDVTLTAWLAERGIQALTPAALLQPLP